MLALGQACKYRYIPKVPMIGVEKSLRAIFSPLPKTVGILRLKGAALKLLPSEIPLEQDPHARAVAEVLLIVGAVRARERSVEEHRIGCPDLSSNSVREPRSADIFRDVTLLDALEGRRIRVALEVVVDGGRHVDLTRVIGEVGARLEAEAADERRVVVLFNADIAQSMTERVVVALHVAVGELGLRRHEEGLRDVPLIPDFSGEAEGRVVVRGRGAFERDVRRDPSHAADQVDVAAAGEEGRAVGGEGVAVGIPLRPSTGKSRLGWGITPQPGVKPASSRA